MENYLKNTYKNILKIPVLYPIQFKIVLNIKTLDAYNLIYTSHNNN